MKLVLEILSGPLDGQILTLESETAWGKKGEGPLIFPWDTELGNCQAKFFPKEGSWWIGNCSAFYSTYCLNRKGQIENSLQLKGDDLLQSCATLLLVREI